MKCDCEAVKWKLTLPIELGGAISIHCLSMCTCRDLLDHQGLQGHGEKMENEGPLVPLAMQGTVGSRERRETTGYSELVEHRDPKDHP